MSFGKQTAWTRPQGVSQLHQINPNLFMATAGQAFPTLTGMSINSSLLVNQAAFTMQLIEVTNEACRRMQSAARKNFFLTLRPKPQPKKPEKFKTQLCNHYIQTGFCRFGSACWFAHGKDELHDAHELF